MNKIERIQSFRDGLAAELSRAGAVVPAAVTDHLLRVARGFLEAGIDVGDAAGWLALGVGPDAAVLIAAEAGLTPAGFHTYAEHLHSVVPHLPLELVAEWALTGVPAAAAAVWACHNYRPDEAAPLIAAGIDPYLAGAADEAAVTAYGGHAEHLRAEVRRLAEHTPGLTIDPALAEWLALDDPAAAPAFGQVDSADGARSVVYEVAHVQIGDSRYEEIVGQLRDLALLEQMWADAEHRLDEQPGKVWTIVLVRDHGRWVPAAWAAATVEQHDDGPVLSCSDNYERRGVGREFGLYALAHRHRHQATIVPAGLPAVTYLFEQPIALHESLGWYRTGLHDISRQPDLDPHAWWELRRDPGR